jgi:mannose-1-phosphate guanylyltransferase/mannose-6-phosphate isomerase
MIGPRQRRHAVVMAGGAGERFWPRSRRAHPKPLLRVLGRATLLDAALAHARRFAGAERTWIVCTAANAKALRRASGLPAKRVLVEPTGRDTAAAVAYAAAAIARRDPDAVLAMLPADHVIQDGRAFAAALDRAARAADRARVLVTLGIRPTAPETGYGYIEVGRSVGRTHPGLHRVLRFHEKPPLAAARRYLARGRHLWNAGIFVWRADAILGEIESVAPEVGAAFADWRRRPSAAALARAYRRVPKLPIDRAVLERSDRVWTLPVRFPWNDVGTWASLAAELGVGRGRSHVVAGDSVLVETTGSLVWGADRLVALFGVAGLAVIDTPDALLVARLDRTGDAKRVVAELARSGRKQLL